MKKLIKKLGKIIILPVISLFGTPKSSNEKIYCKYLNKLQDYYDDQGDSSLCPSCVPKNNKEKYDLQIIVPVYNVEKYLKSCIDSILNQETKYSYCVSCINDGSTDLSLDILNSYKQKSNVFIVNQENRGLSGARNTGLTLLKSKYIMFVDSDDELLPNAIDNLLTKAISDDCDIVQGNYITFTDSEERISKCVQKNISGFAWGKIYKTSVFYKNNYLIAFPLSYWFEDTVVSFIYKFLAKKKACIDNYVYSYRINEFGITKTSRRKHKTLDTFYVTKKLLEDREKLNLPFDCSFRKTLLNQFVVNTKRLNTLNNKKINKYVFYCSKYLYEQYYNYNVKDLNEFYYIEKALSTNNYLLFYLFCLFN